MNKVWKFQLLCNRRRHIAIHPVCQSCTKSEWLGMYCEWSNWNWLWKKTLNCLIQIHTNLKLFLKKIVWYGHWFSTFLRWDQRKIGPVKVNQKMAFFGFVKYQFGLDPEFWKAGVENLLLLLSIKKHLLRNKFKLQVSLLRLLQNHRIKTAIAEKQNWKFKTTLRISIVIILLQLYSKIA